MSPLKTLDEAAAFLRIGKSTLRAAVTARRVPFTYPAGVKVAHFSDEDLADIIRDGRQEPIKGMPVVTRSRRRAA